MNLRFLRPLSGAFVAVALTACGTTGKPVIVENLKQPTPETQCWSIKERVTTEGKKELSRVIVDRQYSPECGDRMKETVIIKEDSAVTQARIKGSTDILVATLKNPNTFPDVVAKTADRIIANLNSQDQNIVDAQLKALKEGGLELEYVQIRATKPVNCVKTANDDGTFSYDCN